MTETIAALDAAALLFIQEHVRCAFLTPVMTAFSWLGDAGRLWIALGVFLLLFRSTRRGAFDLAAGAAVPWVFTEFVLKDLFARPRPYTTVEGLHILIEPLTSFSFPSGHACVSMAAATSLALIFRGRGGAWAFLPAALIALSRVYVGVHYPSDVLAGALIGATGAFLICLLMHGRKRSG